MSLKSRNWRLDALSVGALACITVFSYFDVTLLGRTISFNPAGASGKVFGGVIPLQDHSASSFQDEPWLFMIGKALRAAEIPIVNFRNGLPSPLLESLQAAPFYFPHVLLAVFPLNSPQFFDYYNLLHLFILGVGCFFLSRFFLPAGASLLFASLFMLSPIVTGNIGMVHFRTFTWAPWVVGSMLRVCSRKHAPEMLILGFVSLLLAATSGNPQELIFIIGATYVLAVFEVCRSKTQWTRLVWLIPITFSAILTSAPSLWPYFDGVSSGELHSHAKNLLRSSFAISSQWMGNLVIPYVNGIYPVYSFNNAISSASHDDRVLAAIRPAFVVFALSFLLFSVRSKNRTALLACFFPVAAIVFILLKAMNFCLLGWTSLIPIISTLRWSKYLFSMHLMVFVLALAGAQKVIEDRARQKYLLLWTLLSWLLIMATVFLFAHLDASRSLDLSSVKQLPVIWFSFSLIPIVLTGCFLVNSKRMAFSLGLLVILLAIVARPIGSRLGNPYAVQASFVPEVIKDDRFRVLDEVPANANLILGYSNIGVVDPVVFSAFYDHFTSEIPCHDQLCNFFPKRSSKYSSSQEDFFKLMGVRWHRSNWEVDSGSAKDFQEFTGAVPIIFAIDRSNIPELHNLLSLKKWTDALALITSDKSFRTPSAVFIGVNSIRFSIPISKDNTIVASLIPLRGLSLEGYGRPGRLHPLFAFWNPDSNQEEFVINYSIPIMKLSFVAGIVGISCFALTLMTYIYYMRGTD